jgi:predicted XRE-type DNA-binding protein
MMVGKGKPLVWVGSGRKDLMTLLPDAEKLKIRFALVIEIRKAMHALGLNQQETAKRMDIP